MERGGLDPTPTVNPQGNIATVEFKLLSALERDLSTIAAMQAWREKVGILPYVRGIAFAGRSSISAAPWRLCCRTRTRRT